MSAAAPSGSAPAASESPQSRVPRNSRLSAYYTRQSSDAPSTTASRHQSLDIGTSASSAARPDLTTRPTPPSSLPSSADEETAVAFANSLAKSLPLPDLLTRASALRADADSVSESLHLSSRRYYTHLASAAEAADAALTQVRNARGADHVVDGAGESVTPLARESPSGDMLSNLSSLVSSSRDTAERLSVTRAEVDALDGVRVLTALTVASQHLPADLTETFALATDDLCTEPDTARAAFVLSCRRYVAAITAVRALAPHAPHFEQLSKKLDETTVTLRAGLCEQLMAARQLGDGGALSDADLVRLSIMLGEPEDNLRELYLRAAAARLTRIRPTEASLAAAAVPIRLVRLHTDLMSAEALPMIQNVANEFVDLAGEKQQPSDSLLEQLALWASDVVEDNFSSRSGPHIGGTVFTFKEGKIANAADVAGLLSSLRRLLGTADSLEKAGERTPNYLVGSVVRAAVTSLVNQVVKTARTQADSSMTSIIQERVTRLAGGEGSRQVRAAQAAQAIAETAEHFHETLTTVLEDTDDGWCSPDSFLDRGSRSVTAFATEDAQLVEACQAVLSALAPFVKDVALRASFEQSVAVLDNLRTYRSVQTNERMPSDPVDPKSPSLQNSSS